MPGFAWYYLQKGTTLRKNAMAALQPKGEIGKFETPTEKDVVIRPDQLKGNRWLIAIIGTEDRSKFTPTILNIYKQSKDEFLPNILFLTGLEMGESIPIVSQQLKLPSDNPKWLICYFAKEHLFPFSKDAFNIIDTYANKSCVMLVDENLQIRNTYLLSEDSDVKQLVRHYPVFLSLKK
ncbi:MAG: hypothetical protein ABI851_02510 [Saprospiraceae bacterium]